MTRQSPDPEGLDRNALGREVTANQEHGLWIFEEPQLDCMGRPIHGWRLDDGLIACCGKLRKEREVVRVERPLFERTVSPARWEVSARRGAPPLEDWRALAGLGSRGGARLLREVAQ